MIVRSLSTASGIPSGDDSRATRARIREGTALLLGCRVEDRFWDALLLCFWDALLVEDRDGATPIRALWKDFV